MSSATSYKPAASKNLLHKNTLWY